MNPFRKKTLQILCVILLMFPLISFSTYQAFGLIDIGPESLATNATETYFEDFNGITFRDPTTNAFGWGLGTVTNDRAITINPLDFLETPHDVREIAVQGRKAYAVFYNKTSTNDSFGCLNINDPANIELLSTRDSFYGMTSIAVDGDILYVGKGAVPLSNYHQIGTYNASDPFSLGAPGYYLQGTQSDGVVTDIEPQGHYVFYTSYNDVTGKSVRILESADPDNTANFTLNWPSSKALGLAVVDHLLYVAASDEGFFILNKTDFSSPIEMGHIPLPGNASDVLINGIVAYVALGDEGIAAINILDPFNPQLIGIFDTPGITNRLALQGNTLFVTDGPEGVHIFDVADPTHFTFVDTIPVPSFVWDIDLYGKVLVVGSDDGIHTFEIGGITDISNHFYVNAFDGFEAWDVKVQGDIAYVAAGPDGFYTLNVRDPANPVLLDHVPAKVGQKMSKIDVAGQFAYVIDPNNASVYDIRDPNNIQLLYSAAGNNLGDVFVNGEIVYVSWMAGGYAAINASTPYQFDFTNEYDEPHFGTNITSIFVQGYHVYAVDYIGGVGNGFIVLDQRDLANQVVISERTMLSYNYDVIGDGDIVYHSDENYCVISNVSNPFSTVRENDLENETSNFVKSVGVWNFGPYVMSVHPDETHFVDATDYDITTSSRFNLATGAKAVTMSGDYTYIANTSNLLILRHFESTADTYIDVDNLALSTKVSTVNDTITSATLTIDAWIYDQANVEFFMTADGTNWEAVTPNTLHTFVNTGTDLRWRAIFDGDIDRSAHLYTVEIEYTYNAGGGFTLPPFDITDPVWIGIIAGGGGLVLIIIIIIIVSAVRKKKKRAVTTR